MNAVLLAIAAGGLVRDEHRRQGAVAAAQYDGLKLDDECKSLPGFCNEPCEREYVWLDSPRQSCRYPEEFKLLELPVTLELGQEVDIDDGGVVLAMRCDGAPCDEEGMVLRTEAVVSHVDDHVVAAAQTVRSGTVIVSNAARFFAPELDRLVDKSRTFADGGCLFGGWMRKCYRRMRQIVRLQKFINEVVKAYPALAATPEAAAKFAEIRENMKRGFTQWERRHKGEDPPCFVQALKLMTVAEDQASVLEAFLAVSCAKMTDAEKQELREKFELIEKQPEDEDPKKFVKLLEQDLDSVMTAEAEKDEEALERADPRLGAPGELPDPRSEDELPLAQGDQAQVAVGAQAHVDTSLVEVGSELAAGQGPLQILAKKPLAIFSWFFTRLAWLLLFTGGFLWNLGKAVIGVPISTLLCVLIRFADWFVVDFVYKGGWEGKWDFTHTYKKIGMCPKEMWDWLITKDMRGSKFFTSPASWASRTTGVWHFYKDTDPCNPDPCANTPNSRCYLGRCYCDAGFYTHVIQGSEAKICQQSATKQGCMCKAAWTKPSGLSHGLTGVLQSALNAAGADPTRYGCHDRKCKTDPNFNGCAADQYQDCSLGNWYNGHYADPAAVPVVKAVPVAGAVSADRAGDRGTTWTGRKVA